MIDQVLLDAMSVPGQKDEKSNMPNSNSQPSQDSTLNSSKGSENNKIIERQSLPATPTSGNLTASHTFDQVR